MRQYRIRGKTRLAGELCVDGAKNAVLPILAASCLDESETVIHNCPRIQDTLVSVEILEKLGCRAEFIENTLTVRSFGDLLHVIPDECVTQMRSSILFMGALLARQGHVTLAPPGGCNLGERAINLHISGLEAMGAQIYQDKTNKKLVCETAGLYGARIPLKFASVGATENLMIAAKKAVGETVIENAAREPEVVDLADFLNKLGADVKGAGSSTIVINGVKKLRSHASHEIIPDRIVAGTYLIAAAITAGEITLTNVRPADMTPFTTVLEGMGCRVLSTESTISLVAPDRLRSVSRLKTDVHPHFPTDMQAQFVAALSIAAGRSIVTETIFDKRFSHANELKKMGADIHTSADNRIFTVNGVSQLHGATVTAHDLRCGAALVLAALAAEGETVVQNAQYVERGYANIEKDLAAIGADISLEVPETVGKVA